MFVLLRESNGSVRRIEIAGNTAMIGRTPACDVVVDEPFVSKHHLRLFHGTVIQDLGSSNGTFVDGAPLRDVQLLGGSWATLGRSDVSVRVELDEDANSVESTFVQPASASPAPSEDRLRAIEEENGGLRERIAELERTAEPTPAQHDASAAADELATLRRENDELRRSLEAALAAAPGRLFPQSTDDAESSATDTEVQPGASPRPSPLAPLLRLVEEDAEGTPAPQVHTELTSFLALEGQRFLRRAERVITELAGTVLPGVESALRPRLAAMLSRPRDPRARQDYLDFLRELGRWLVVSLGAHRESGARFVDRLERGLVEGGLTQPELAAAVARLAGHEDEARWRRATQLLGELSQEAARERLARLTGDAADRLFANEAREAFS